MVYILSDSRLLTTEDVNRAVHSSAPQYCYKHPTPTSALLLYQAGDPKSQEKKTSVPGQGTEWAQAVWAVLLQDHTLREYLHLGLSLCWPEKNLQGHEVMGAMGWLWRCPQRTIHDKGLHMGSS